MPGYFRCTCGDYARVLFSFAREAAGASSARHSLRPLLLGAAKQFLQNSGEIAPRDRGFVFGVAVIARSEATKQSTLTSRQHGLLRFARNDGFLISNMSTRSRGAMRPSAARTVRPTDQRAQGMPGARCARSLV